MPPSYRNYWINAQYSVALQKTSFEPAVARLAKRGSLRRAYGLACDGVDIRFSAKRR